MIEQQDLTSYSACGLPYWIAGDVPSAEDLIARTPEGHRDRGIDVRVQHRAVGIDAAHATVTILGPNGEAEDIQYDQLVIGTGASPIRPAIPGIEAPNVHGIATIADGQAIIDRLASGSRRAVVIGAGYVGIEMAEALCRQGLDVTLVDRAEQPMTTIDPDMGELLRTSMVEGLGMSMALGEGVVEIAKNASGLATAVVTDTRSHPADIVVLAIGVRPNTDLARDAGLALGAHGGIITDACQRVLGTDNIWAAGDCCETRHLVTGESVHMPLGTHANKQGRVVGVNLTGGDLVFPGVVGTAASKVCNLEVARTGLMSADAERVGLDHLAATVRSSTTVGYMPGSARITVKAIAQRDSGRLLGVQIVGEGPGSAKRIDSAAVAITLGLDVERVASLDLSYAPPFSPVWDPVQIACRRIATLL